MKNLMLFLGTVCFCSSLCAYYESKSITGNKSLDAKLTSRVKVPGKIVAYVDRKQLGERSETWHKLSTSISKKQAEIQSILEKQKNDIEASFITMSSGASKEELSDERGELRNKLVVKFKRLQEDAESELRSFVAGIQQKIERIDEQAKKEVIAKHNAKAKDAFEKVGSIVEKIPGTVVAEDNDFTIEVAEAFDTIAQRESLGTKNDDLKEKVSKGLFLAENERREFAEEDNLDTKLTFAKNHEKEVSKKRGSDVENSVMAAREDVKVFTAKDVEALIKPTSTQVAENTFTSEEMAVEG